MIIECLLWFDIAFNNPYQYFGSVKLYPKEGILCKHTAKNMRSFPHTWK